jgi:protein phosphatase
MNTSQQAPGGPTGSQPLLPKNMANEKNFKFASNAIVVEEYKKNEEIKVKKIPIMAEEGRGKGLGKGVTLQNQMNAENAIHMMFLNELLQPKAYINLPENAKFSFRSEHIIQLCEAAERIMISQPMVLQVRAPLKIFGDIHGQYSDLMRFFDLWGSPCDGQQDGDIESLDYLFLGDFIDRGSHSLETICLLLALKVRYPDQVHLLRGNHEDKWINNGFGFSEECAIRLGEDPNEDDSVFSRMNRLFEYLPLAAVIDQKVICLHGGIGASLNYVEEIEHLPRPLEVIHEVVTQEQQLVVDILWSDPTDSDYELGILPNTIRDPSGTGNIVKFGPDRVKQFLANNNLSMIIRAHECVMDGFERFAAGSLITLFSATDYCGKHKNAGAVLILKKNFEIIPKLIYPSETGQGNWMEDEESLKRRPPTPPRWKKEPNRY